MKQYLHGGNHPGMLEFSANLNPLGIPKEIKQAIHDAVDHLEDYPDPNCDKLRDALGKQYGINPDSIICTAGASDAIMRICQAVKPANALVSAPCFSGYEKALDAVGCAIDRFSLDYANDFDIPMEFADRIQPKTDIVFICTPNNPTGRIVSHSTIDRIAKSAKACDAILVIDESFLDFTNQASAATLTQQMDNVVILGSFTKMYAMAGIRLGYAIYGSHQIKSKMDLVGMDWAVSTSAQAAGLAALSLDGFVQRTRAYVDEQRAMLTNALRQLGIKVIEGAANYLLIQANPSLAKQMAQKNIAIRTCGDYHGLDNTWFRIAVRTEKENEILINAIREAIHDR